MTSEQAISVVIVDDHDLFRRGLRELLEERGFRVAGEATDGEQAVALTLRARPDVAIMDLSMPEVSGVEATRRMARDAPGVAVLVLTVSASTDDLVEALAAGAVGYLLKDAPADEIARAIHAAAGGDAVLDPRVASRLLGRFRESLAAAGTVPPVPALSERELDVLRLLAEGLGNEEIAARLYLSPKTVKNQVSAILVKLGVENRVQAAVLAVRAGLA